MPEYTLDNADEIEEQVPSDETTEHVHTASDGNVYVVTLRDGGEDADEQYDGEPYTCDRCGFEVDYEDDHGSDGEEEEDVDEGAEEEEQAEEESAEEDYDDQNFDF